MKHKAETDGWDASPYGPEPRVPYVWFRSVSPSKTTRYSGHFLVEVAEIPPASD